MSDLVNEGALLGLPETQSELDNLTEYNTAHNRRISMLGITDDTNYKKNKAKRKKKMVTFNEEEIIINPEDIDPSIGRFRNLIQSVVVQTTNKRQKLDHFAVPTSPTSDSHKPLTSQPYVTSMSLYQGLNEPIHEKHPNAIPGADTHNHSAAFGSNFLILPNPAPEVSTDIVASTATQKGLYLSL